METLLDILDSLKIRRAVIKQDIKTAGIAEKLKLAGYLEGLEEAIRTIEAELK